MDETQKNHQLLHGRRAEMARTGPYITLVWGLMPKKRYLTPQPGGGVSFRAL
jgi:hypothetical protein